MKNKAQLSGVLIAVIVVIALIFFIVLWAIGAYNGLVQKDVAVEKAWGNVQTAYQRRVDLIPNLVETVKGEVKFEQDTQTKIAALRSGIASATNPTELSAAGAQVNDFIRGINVNVEAYPDLKASQNFLALKDELAGTENRIKWERDNFNAAVQSYKTSVRSFPTNFIAGMYGFVLDKWKMFEADEGAQNAPKVNFTG
jgi:LemA protein